MSESTEINIEQSSTSAAEAVTPHPRRWPRLLLVVVVSGTTILAGMLWWQERRLSEAEVALEKGDTQYAMYLVTRLLKSNPNNSRALALQARALVAGGYSDDAIKIFDRIGAASAEDLHALAKAFMLQQEWTSAVPLLTRVQQMTPNNPDVLYELTTCQMRLGQFGKALETAQLFGKVSGQRARAEVLLGSIYGGVRNNAEAAKAFERVLELEPKAENLQIPPGEFFLWYGRVLMDLGKPQEALEPLKLSASTQQTGEVFVLLGDAAIQLGKQENAVLAWKKAIEVDPKNAAARTSLANAALLANDAKQAREWLEPLRHGELTSAVAYLFQRTYALEGDESEAQAWQKKAAELRREESVYSALEHSVLSDPNAFWSRAAKAHLFASEGNWVQAELIVAQLVQEQPGEPFIIELADAIRRKSRLPPLTRIPVKQF